MSSWVVIPCLLSLQKEFDKVNPNRDKGAEGFVGDSSHTSSSDHTPDEDSDKLKNKDSDHINEVHAYDCDSTGPWPNTNFHALVMKVIEGEKKKWKDPNDKCRLNYVIHDREIYDKDNDFNPVPYTGSDPHTNHAHFSARYETSCEEDVRPWGVAEGGDDVTKEEFMQWSEEFNAKTNVGFATHAINGIGGSQPVYQTLADTAGRTNIIKADTASIKTTLATMQGQLDEIKASIEGHVSGIIEGETQKPPANPTQ